MQAKSFYVEHKMSEKCLILRNIMKLIFENVNFPVSAILKEKNSLSSSVLCF